MRFILQYPEASGSGIDLLDAGAIADVAAAAEDAGWDGIALTEHPAPSNSWLESGGHQSLDPFVALASAAGVTTTLALVTNLSVIPYRNPLLLAKSAATLNRMSEGRFYWAPVRDTSSPSTSPSVWTSRSETHCSKRRCR